MTNSTEARPIVVDALHRVLGRSPVKREIYAVQAVARFDGGYGNFRSPPHGPEGPTSNNWGAVQDTKNFNSYVIWSGIMNPDKTSPETKAFLSKPAPRSPKPNEFFYGADYSKSKGWFHGPYKAYPDPVDGAAHVASLLKKMGVLEVARQPGSNWNDIARKMYEGKYFGGYSSDPEVNIRNYAKNLAAGGEHFAELFGEPDPFGGMKGAEKSGPLAKPGPELEEEVPETDPSPSYLVWELPTLRIGSSGDGVRLWQRLLNSDSKRGVTLSVDGAFGPLTETSTKHWQSRRKLTVDGVVGPKSWNRMP